jgi:hypothetical protein
MRRVWLEKANAEFFAQIPAPPKKVAGSDLAPQSYLKPGGLRHILCERHL